MLGDKSTSIELIAIIEPNQAFVSKEEGEKGYRVCKAVGITGFSLDSQVRQAEDNKYIE